LCARFLESVWDGLRLATAAKVIALGAGLDSWLTRLLAWSSCV
jgi:O-methyltransferase involved in polyketide biosynthesis